MIERTFLFAILWIEGWAMIAVAVSSFATVIGGVVIGASIWALLGGKHG